MLGQSHHLIGGILWIQNPMRAVHCNLSQNGLDHQVCTEDVTSPLDELPISRGVAIDDDSPTYLDQREPIFQQASDPLAAQPGNLKLSKPVALWTQQDVCKWLKKHCPNQHQIYNDSFKQHDITGRALMRLTDRKLERMGIMQESQRQHVLQQVLQLRVREEVRNLQLLTQAELVSPLVHRNNLLPPPREEEDVARDSKLRRIGSNLRPTKSSLPEFF